MADAVWYFADGDVQRGPITEAQLRALIGTGNLTPEDQVWKEGMEDWTPAGEVAGLFNQAASATPPATPAHRRRPMPRPNCPRRPNRQRLQPTL